MLEEAKSFTTPDNLKNISLNESIDLLSHLKKQIGIEEIIEEVLNF